VFGGEQRSRARAEVDRTGPGVPEGARRRGGSVSAEATTRCSASNSGAETAHAVFTCSLQRKMSHLQKVDGFTKGTLFKTVFETVIIISFERRY